MSSSPNTVERTSRQVIESKLLTALQDENVVACLFTKDDLDTIHAALCGYDIAERKGSVLSWSKHIERCKEMAKSIDQLRREAFK